MVGVDAPDDALVASDLGRIALAKLGVLLFDRSGREDSVDLGVRHLIDLWEILVRVDIGDGIGV